MTTQLIKSDGRKEVFEAKKVIRSITRAAKDAKLSPEEINSVVNEVSNKVIQYAESKDKVLSSDIRNRILADLDLNDPLVSAEWRKFMNARRR